MEIPGECLLVTTGGRHWHLVGAQPGKRLNTPESTGHPPQSPPQNDPAPHVDGAEAGKLH